MSRLVATEVLLRVVAKADVIAMAANLADSEGFDKLSLSAVAAALGIRTPSLYNHIGGLAGLRREMAVLGLRELSAQLGRSAIGRERDHAVKEIARAYRKFARDHPGLYTATLQPLTPELQSVGHDLVAIVLAVVDGYGLGPDGSLHAVRGLRSALHGFVSLEAAGQFAMPLAIDDSFDRLVDTIISGLRNGAE